MNTNYKEHIANIQLEELRKAIPQSTDPNVNEFTFWAVNEIYNGSMRIEQKKLFIQALAMTYLQQQQMQKFRY